MFVLTSDMHRRLPPLTFALVSQIHRGSCYWQWTPTDFQRTAFVNTASSHLGLRLYRAGAHAVPTGRASGTERTPSGCAGNAAGGFPRSDTSALAGSPYCYPNAATISTCVASQMFDLTAADCDSRFRTGSLKGKVPHLL